MTSKWFVTRPPWWPIPSIVEGSRPSREATAPARSPRAGEQNVREQVGRDSTVFAPCMYLRVSRQGIPAPKALFAPNPEYPVLARESRIAGVVVLAAANRQGRVDAVKILRTLKPAFDESAIAAVRRWEFVPVMKDGNTVAVQMQVEIIFKPQ